MSKPCCLNCKDRYLGCHKNCKFYKEYKDRLALINKNKQKYNLLDGYKKY